LAGSKTLHLDGRTEMDALDKLDAWVLIQIDGLQRSSMVEASFGAINAFGQVRLKIAELKQSTSGIPGRPSQLSRQQKIDVLRIIEDAIDVTD